jgi:hypothetical protein
LDEKSGETEITASGPFKGYAAPVRTPDIGSPIGRLDPLAEITESVNVRGGLPTCVKVIIESPS